MKAQPLKRQRLLAQIAIVGQVARQKPSFFLIKITLMLWVKQRTPKQRRKSGRRSTLNLQKHAKITTLRPESPWASWKKNGTLFDKYKSINDNNKATGRGREKFEFFDVMDSFLGFSDKVNPRFVSETAIQRDISSGTESSPSPSASTSASCSSFETGPDSDAETSAPDPAKGKRKAAKNKQGEDALAIRKSGERSAEKATNTRALSPC